MKAFRWFSFLLFIWLACGSAHAERRVALVIGNSTYKSVPRLANPVNDAALVGGMFSKAGFDVVDIKLDLTVVDMRKALREFGAKARDSDVAVIYYAGHGIELDGNNYLIPTDAALETDTDVLDETFPLDRVLFAIEPARQLRLVILDACRDNPFAKTMKRTVAARAIGRGLAKVEPASPNTMIALPQKRAPPPQMATGKTARSRPRWSSVCRSPGWTCAKLLALFATMSSKIPATSRSPTFTARSVEMTCRWCRQSQSSRLRRRAHWMPFAGTMNSRSKPATATDGKRF